MIDFLVRLTATVFFIGYLPLAPGTCGSLPGLWLAWVGDGLAQAMLCGGLCTIGFWSCRHAVRVFGAQDPKPFVLDECCGMMISVLGLPKDLLIFLAAFVLFRSFDVLKPWPVRFFDLRKKPKDIMLDDLAAGLAVNLILRLVLAAKGVLF